jgi:hypothetical protein
MKKKPGFSLFSQFKGVEKALQNPKTPTQLLPSLRRREQELRIAMGRQQMRPRAGLFNFLRKKG